MNKQRRRYELISRLREIGFSYDESVQLRRIEMTLHRWHEEEANGTIQRDGDNGEGRPRRYYETQSGEIIRGSIIPDHERGALARLGRVMAGHPDFLAYVQGDCRGCALYILSKKDVRAGEDINAVYTRGLPVCD